MFTSYYIKIHLINKGTIKSSFYVGVQTDVKINLVGYPAFRISDVENSVSRQKFVQISGKISGIRPVVTFSIRPLPNNRPNTKAGYSANCISCPTLVESFPEDLFTIVHLVGVQGAEEAED